MADTLDLAKPLKLSTPGLPPIAGLTIDSIDEVGTIDSPWVGMIFSAGGKSYKVLTLKARAVGPLTIPDAAIDTYEPVPDQSDLAGKAEKNHTHANYALKTELPDLTNYLTVSVAAATYAAKDHTHAGYENRLSTLETASAAIFHLGIVRPNYDDALHLQIQENGVTVVDTADAEGRAKVKVFTGQEWADFPSGGAGAPFSGMSVDIDLTSLGGGSHYLRYKWYNASTSTDWVGVTFPSSGGGGGAGGGSGSSDFSVYIDPSTGNWIINGEDSGVCSAGKLQVVTSIPDDPVEGMILIS